MNDTATLTIPDIVILIGYLFIVVTVGLWSPVIQFISKYFRKKQDDNTQATTEDYFLASRSVSWWAIGASLFCSNIGSEHFIGLAGTGSREGITVGYEKIFFFYNSLLLAIMNYQEVLYSCCWVLSLYASI